MSNKLFLQWRNIEVSQCRSQDRALHYSASRGKNETAGEQCLLWRWRVIATGCSASLDGLRQQQAVKSNDYREQITELSTLCAGQEDEVETERQHLIDYKKQVALAAINSRSGKSIPPQVGLSRWEILTPDAVACLMLLAYVLQNNFWFSPFALWRVFPQFNRLRTTRGHPYKLFCFQYSLNART